VVNFKTPANIRQQFPALRQKTKVPNPAGYILDSIPDFRPRWIASDFDAEQDSEGFALIRTGAERQPAKPSGPDEMRLQPEGTVLNTVRQCQPESIIDKGELPEYFVRHLESCGP
jgi:hypothetical protein